MPINITFRTHLVGSVTEFSQNTKLNLIANPLVLVELIVLLSRYQEEGVALAPKVYMTNDIDSLTAMLPNSESLKIGTSNNDVEGVKKALKKCAPLATGGWLIYISEKDSEIEYGLFKDSGNPISVLVDDILMTSEDHLIIVKVFQIAADCVEIKANNDSLHYIFLNHRREDSPPPLQYLDNLVEQVTKNINDEFKEPTFAFMKRLLFEALRHSHGCIIAVTNMHKVPQFLAKDGIILDEPINFADLVEELQKKNIDASVLESKGSLLQGMLNSDGIIVFDNKGCLLGYNCFVKINEKSNAIGGARRRAYASLETKIHKGICSVFMQSQDGWTEFKGIE
jgi:hypothetical protein